MLIELLQLLLKLNYAYLNSLKSLCEVNRQGGSSVSWRKHGVDYGWRLSMYLAGWLSVSGTAEELVPDPSDPTADAEVRALVSRAQVSRA